MVINTMIPAFVAERNGDSKYPTGNMKLSYAEHVGSNGKMTAILETTGGLFPPHTYLVEGTDLIAYIRAGHSDAYYFKRPIKGFSKSGRKFVEVKPNPFTVVESTVEVNTAVLRVQGSKPNVWYNVDTEQNTCTCPGYTFRGACKHIKQLEPA